MYTAQRVNIDRNATNLFVVICCAEKNVENDIFVDAFKHLFREDWVNLGRDTVSGQGSGVNWPAVMEE